MTSSEIPQIVTLDQIEKITSEPMFAINLIQGIADGFVALEQGKFFACPIQTMGLPPFPFVETQDYAAQTCVKSGYFKGGDYYVIKVASGGKPLPNSGLMQVYSQKTGKLKAILLDNGVLTEVRTAAVGALACKALGPLQIDLIGIVGTGVQARYQLRMLSNTISCRDVLVWGRNPKNAATFCVDMKNEGWNVTVVDNPDLLLKECDIIVTTTCSREPVLGHDLSMLKQRKRKALHITCIGADAPGKVELTSNLVAKSNYLVADTLSQTQERGEFRKALSDGLVEIESITSLGTLLQLEGQYRKNVDDDQLTIFDSSGVALQDCVVSEMVFNALATTT